MKKPSEKRKIQQQHTQKKLKHYLPQFFINKFFILHKKNFIFLLTAFHDMLKTRGFIYCRKLFLTLDNLTLISVNMESL